MKIYQITGICLFAIACGFATISGCSSLTADGISSGPADGKSPLAEFAPLPLPPNFDPQKAKMALAELPDDPAVPQAKEPPESKETSPQAQRRLDEAKRLFAEQRYTETINELEKALRLDPNNAQAHRLMALACLLSGNEARARHSAERALAIQINDLAGHYVLGRFAGKAGKTDEAIKLYRLALKCQTPAGDESYRALTHYYLGSLLYDAGYFTAAIEQLEAFEADLDTLGEKAADNPELATILRVHRGAAAIRTARANGFLGKYGPAADGLEKASARSPQDFELRAEYIRMLARAKRVEQAVREATRFLADSQGNREALELLLAVNRFAGRPEQGVIAIRQVIAQQPENVELLMLYADALIAAGRGPEGVQSLKDLLAKHPDEEQARWKLIELYRLQNEWPAWLGELAGILAAEPKNYIKVAQELERVPLAGARKIIQSSADSAPPTSQPSDIFLSANDYLLALLNHRLDRSDEAQRLFNSAVQRTPGFMPAVIGSAEIYLQQCRWTHAVQSIEAAQAAGKPPSHQLERLLGRAYDGLDDLEQAAQHYEKAIALDRGDVQTRLLLGKMHDRTGQSHSAQKQYQEAITIDAHNIAAREALIRNVLSRLGPALALQENQNLHNRALSEVTEMQRLAPDHPGTRRCAALLKFISDRNREAYAAALKKLVQEHPADLQSREDLVKVLLEYREHEAARAELNEMLAREPASAGAHELMASVLVKLLMFDEADEQFKRMTSMYPNREAWLRQWVELCLIRLDYDAAIALGERILSLKGIKGVLERQLPYRQQLIQTYREAKRFDEAQKAASAWLHESSTDDRFRRVYRSFLLTVTADAKDYEQYVRYCRTWLTEPGENPEVQRWLMIGLVRLHRENEAIAMALESLASNPEDENKLDFVIDVLQTAHRSDEAVELAKSQLALADKPNDKWRRIGVLMNVYMRARRYDDAVSALKDLITQGQQLSGEDSVYELEKTLGRILTLAHRFDEAVRHLNGLLSEAKSDQRKAELLRLQSWAHQRQGQMDVAEQRMREALALAPTDAGINNDLGYTLADAGKQLEQAKAMIRLAVAEEPHTAAYLDSYGWVLYKLGEFAEARLWLQRATNMEGGDDPVLFDHLGDVLWRMGEKEAAVKNWKRSLELNDEKVAEGEEPMEKEVGERVKQKIEAAAGQAEPEVAPIPPASKPAS